MTDLTKEELSELERYGLRFEIINAAAPLALEILPTKLANLAAMAKRTEAAERERDAYMALADTKAAEATALGRERDVLMDQAGAAGMKVEALASKCTHLEIERDTLRATLRSIVEWAEDGPDGCFSCSPSHALDGARHESWCWVPSAQGAALTQHGDAGGA